MDASQLTKNYDYVLRVCQKLCKDVDLGYDLAQTTMVRAWANLDKFKGDSNIRTWLCSIAFNEFRNQLRKAKHQELPLLEGHDKACPSNLDEQLHLAAVLQDIGFELFLAAIGHSYSEIAKARGISRAAVTDRIFHQRARARKRHGR